MGRRASLWESGFVLEDMDLHPFLVSSSHLLLALKEEPQVK